MPGVPRSRAAIRGRERVVEAALTLCGALSLATTIAIVVVLALETLRFLAQPEVKLLDFLTGTEWNPMLGSERHFGVLPLVTGTLLVMAIAILLALPIGVLVAVFLSEFAPRRLRALLKPVIEVLAGVPTVVYGFFALTVITPTLQALWSGFEVYNALSAGLAVGIMCIPIVCSLTEDALQAVPRSLREGAYALGATKFEAVLEVVLPAALSGVIAAALLAVARAVGETMIVALAAGNLPQLGLNPAVQTQTMTAYMVQIFLGDASHAGPEYLSSYAVAAVLFLLTLALTWIGNKLRLRYREVYE